MQGAGNSGIHHKPSSGVSVARLRRPEAARREALP
jgi:hypothetical protein